jgi:hypothetical protein
MNCFANLQLESSNCASLHVKHLNPLAQIIIKTARYKQGEAFYTRSYGFNYCNRLLKQLSFMKSELFF